VSDAPDAAALRAIVAAALSAPSGDNCQPWRFAWDGEVLAIAHDAGRGVHPINRANLASLLALGCAVEAAALAATRSVA
jgi:sulfur-carrier protein adenylyltransferase/sulfurtransferase